MTAEEKIERLSAASLYSRKATDNEIKELKAIVAKLSRENETLRPFSCRNLKCKDRK